MVSGAMVIRNGTVVRSTGIEAADVFIDGERISSVGPPGSETDFRGDVVDAYGKLVIPGAVDVHTHLDMEVGATRSADDFASGTRAAACGGTTTVLDFATAYRGEAVAQGLATWHAKAEGRAVIDYGFHMALTELTASS
ncbi:hypothetical protein BH18ACT16_BH18ACT16_11530 [soil metagenome]